MKALIVEDEAIARARLAKLITANFKDIEICGETDSIRATVEYVDTHPAPDIIFMDVELSDGDCFEFFRQRDLNSCIVMTTAYDAYAIKAFETGSLDYLLKPIGEEALARAVGRCRERCSGVAVKSYKDHLVVRVGEKYIPVSTAVMAYFLSEDKSNWLVLGDGTRYLVDSTMDALEKVLDPAQFFRISRGCIVSRSAVKSVLRYINGRLKLSLEPESSQDLLVARARVDDFLKWLG
ncbi:MAG: LytR/AlgR family response regulator transcription factor [Candidatus Cryptobacteroides sp.]